MPGFCHKIFNENNFGNGFVPQSVVKAARLSARPEQGAGRSQPGG
jgi:hypothetical protein